MNFVRSTDLKAEGESRREPFHIIVMLVGHAIVTVDVIMVFKVRRGDGAPH